MKTYCMHYCWTSIWIVFTFYLYCCHNSNNVLSVDLNKYKGPQIQRKKSNNYSLSFELLQSLTAFLRVTAGTGDVKDASHPAWRLFQMLPSGRWYRTTNTKTNRVKNSRYPRAVAIIHNKQ